MFKKIVLPAFLYTVITVVIAVLIVKFVFGLAVTFKFVLVWAISLFFLAIAYLYFRNSKESKEEK